MAIIPTGAIYKSLIFDGESSRNYGVYITGEAVYNAPERDVEMVSIPGRNGAFALDNGRFENIEVSYPAGIFADNETDFAEAISDFRNFLCSRNGYVRLTDEYNPGEYRMAIYKSGLEVDPAQLKAGEFEIVFDCKPQRFLTSGETAVTVTDGQTLTNPTLFPASPLIKCKGYGSISFGGDTLIVKQTPIGDLVLSNGASFSASNMERDTLGELTKIRINTGDLNTGDKITVSSSVLTYNLKTSAWIYSSVYVDRESGENWETTCAITSSTTAYFRTSIPNQTFQKGTASVRDYSYWLNWEADEGYVSASLPINIRLEYNGGNIIKISATKEESDAVDKYSISGKIGQINGFSTVIIDDSIYIDLDIGEAYFDDANHSSANYSVTIPAELPTLKPGNNAILISSTFTSVRITPRWWKI